MGKREGQERLTWDDPSEIVARLRNGSPAAVRALRERVRRILGFRGYRIPIADREDLEQEVMSQVWQAVNRAGFDPELGFAKFVEVVAIRRAIDWLRSRRPEVPVPDNLVAGDSPERAARASERSRLAQAALARLDKPCRDLIYLRVSMNKSYREISGLLGRREGALRVQLHRCVRRARDILAELSGEAEAGIERREGR